MDKWRRYVAENNGVVILIRLVSNNSGVSAIDGIKLVFANVTNPCGLTEKESLDPDHVRGGDANWGGAISCG